MAASNCSVAGDLKRRCPDTYTVREDAGSHRGQVVTVQTKNGTSRNLQAYQVANIHGMPQDKILTTTTTIPATVFSQESQVDIRINPILFQAQHVLLELTIRNNGASPLALPPSWILINRMELHKSNGTDEIIENLGEFEYWLSQLHFRQEELETLSHDLNHDKNGNNPWPLAVAETRIIRIPLFNSIWNIARFHHAGITEDMLLRIFFRVNPLESVTGGFGPNTDLLLDQVQLRYRQISQLQQHDARNTAANRSATGMTYRLWEAERHVERKTVAPASTTDFILQGVFGFASYGLFYLTQNDSPLLGATGNFLTTHEIASYDFTDAAEQTLLGGQTMPNAVIRFSHRQAQGWPGRLLQKKFVYIVDHSADPHSAQATGANYGGYAYNDGREKLKITTGPSWPAGAPAGYQTAALPAPLEERDEHRWVTAVAVTSGTYALTFMGKSTIFLPAASTLATIQAEVTRAFGDTGLAFDVAAEGAGTDLTGAVGSGFSIQVSNFGANDRKVPSRQGKIIHMITHFDAAAEITQTQPRTGRTGLQGWVSGDYTLKYFTAVAKEITIQNGRISEVKV